MPDDEQVTLEVNEHTQTLTISAGRYHNNIKGVDAKEFPLVPTGDGVEDPSHAGGRRSICTISSTAWPLPPRKTRAARS